MEGFYSRCLLCTSGPDVTPHLHVYSEAGNHLQLSEKINKYLNVQVVSELPQRVCYSCIEKLEVTHELVTSSQQASIMLLQIKQQIENSIQENQNPLANFDNKQEMVIFNTDLQTSIYEENSDSLVMELDSLQPATYSAATNENSVDTKINEILMDNSVSNCSAEDLEQPAKDFAAHQLNQEPTYTTSKLEAETELMNQSDSETQAIPAKTTNQNQNQVYGGPVKCDICTQTIIHKYYLIEHKNEKHDMKLKFICDHCQKNCSNFHNLMGHIYYHHRTKNYACNYCRKTFITKKWYMNHLKWHHPCGKSQTLSKIVLASVDCNFCGCRSKNKYSLIKHINAKHLDIVIEPLPFCCDECNKVFNNSLSLMQHRKLMHLDKTKCDRCGKMVNRERMPKHLEMHLAATKSKGHSTKELDQPATDSAAQNSEMVLNTNEVPMNMNPEDFEQSANEIMALHSTEELSSTSNTEAEKTLMIFDIKECNFCNLHLYRQVWDLHTSLRHKKQTSHKPANINQNLQCPTCKCILPAESMQSHIFDSHHPKPNPELRRKNPCYYCNIRFSYCDLSQHLESHGSNTWIRCLHCKRMVRNTKIDLETHLFQYHSGGKLLVCQLCDSKYSATGKEQAHMQTYVSFKYKCPLQSCSKVFDTMTSFSYHVLFYHPNFEQDMQGEIKREVDEILQSQTQDELSTRTTVTTLEEPVLNYSNVVECDICHLILKNKYSLVHHKNTNHKMSLTFDCEQCTKKFLTYKKISAHIRVVHAAKDCNCEVCGEPISRYQYKTHMIFHQKHPSKRRPRKLLDSLFDPVYCDICHYCARHKYALVKHINSKHLHVVGEPLLYFCDKCNNEYKKYESLSRHLLTAHLPKLKCDHCGKMVNQRAMLRHLKLHESNCNAMEPIEETSVEPHEEMFTSVIDIEEHEIKSEPEEPD